MFESDDFDEVLSQFDFPVVPSLVNDSRQTSVEKESSKHEENPNDRIQQTIDNKAIQAQTTSQVITCDNKSLNSVDKLSENSNREPFISPKHTKRKIINNHFDHKSKRKFPGPAGLLSGTLEENNDGTICQMELLSQDIEFSQNNLNRELFDSPLWLRLVQDIKLWRLCNVDPIRSIKQQALAGNLRRRKAQIVTAFVEAVDRSVIDPLIVLRDSTGQIKCTLHRDAWSTFSSYLVSEQCALVLWKPTVLTTGSAFKKHYLNITLCNICAIYSSAVINEEDRNIPASYTIVYEQDFTVIKTGKSTEDFFSNPINNEQENGDCNLLDDLDSIFSDDLF